MPKKRYKPKVLPKVLELACPRKGCTGRVLLRCPVCQFGALSVNPSNYSLACGHCGSSQPYVSCGCGFLLKPSYIWQKEREHQILTDQADGSKFVAITTTIGCAAFALWLIVYLGG